MEDVMFVPLVVGFFAAAASYVRVCSWVVGADVPLEADTEDPFDRSEVAA